MLGHGGSSLSSEGGDLAEYSDQLLALLDHLGLPPIDLVGHSMGSLVALEFALAHPHKVRRVVAMNAVFRRTQAQRHAVVGRAEALLATGMSSGIEPTLERWFGNPVPAPMAQTADIVRRSLESAHPVGYPRAYMIFATSDRRHDGRLEGLSMRAQFLTGEFDANSNPDMSRAMASQAPDRRAAVVAGQRHMMSMLAPDLVNAELGRFLDDTALAHVAPREASALRTPCKRHGSVADRADA